MRQCRDAPFGVNLLWGAAGVGRGVAAKSKRRGNAEAWHGRGMAEIWSRHVRGNVEEP